jgi:O-antigen biosynthesis protein
MLIRIRKLLNTLWYQLMRLRYQLTSPSYRLIKNSGLFDADYYLKYNLDIAASGADPLTHYCNSGFAELRNPGPLFDTRYYLLQVPSLAEQRIIPLFHYLTFGRHIGLRPNPLFDPDYYARQMPDHDFSKIDHFSHFLQAKLPVDKTCSPSPFFDHFFYCQKYPDAAQFTNSRKEAYIHYLMVGRNQNRHPSYYFDTSYYLDKTPVLYDTGLDPLGHYFAFGYRERKSPSPLFDAVFYATTYGLAADIDPFDHFLRHLGIEERQPCSWFDPIFYRQTYLAGREDIPSFKHYLQSGQKDCLYPNRECSLLADKPLISILVPVYNVEIAHLNNCIRSVLYQSYPHWQLCLADDCSTDQSIRLVLSQWASSDTRIKVVFLPENVGISAATNAAAQLAEGRYLAFLDNDDELAPTALQTVAQAINDTPAGLYYSDEDLIGADGRQFSIFRKPGYNGELTLCHNYVTHLVVGERLLFEKVGGCAEEFNGAQDLDLFLKLSEQAEKVIHIPKVLYHWRASETSTSINHGKKQYADEAGRQSVANALVRRGIAGEVLFTDWKFFYRAKRSIHQALSVTLVISWEKTEERLYSWLKNVTITAGYKIAQVILLMHTEPSALLAHDLADIDILCKIFRDDQGIAEKINTILGDIQGELIAVVSGDLDIASNQWLSALVEYGQSPDIGMVVGRIDYPIDSCQTVTPIPDCSITSSRYYARFLTTCSSLMIGRQCPQEVLGVGEDLFLMRRDLLIAAGGFDCALFPLLFPVIDFSFKLYQQGKKNIYTPYCRAAISGEGEHPRPQWSEAGLREEKHRFQNKWSHFLDRGDPFYNPGIISDNGQSKDVFKTWLTKGLLD